MHAGPLRGSPRAAKARPMGALHEAMRVLQWFARGVQPPPARSTDAARPGPSNWPFLGGRWRYARGTASRVASSGESSTHGRIARGHARPPVLCTQRAASARTLDRRRTAGPLEVELAISRGPSWRHLREAMHEAIQPKVQLYSAIHRFLRYIIQSTTYNATLLISAGGVSAPT